MKQWTKSRQRQDGVVLLTCLVFLLVLLAMLRFVLGSAKLEEEKAGIDLEIVNAREAAQAALSYAEYFILRQGALNCSGEECTPASSANEIFSANDDRLKNFNNGYDPGTDGLGMKVPAIKDVVGKGLYTGQYIETNAADCQPLWICVDWGKSAGSVTQSAITRGGSNPAKLPSWECTECRVSSGVTVKPRFIIERYTARELADRGLNGLITGGSAGTVVFRVTAVGFGKGAAGSAHMTNVMLQSTYVIPE